MIRGLARFVLVAILAVSASGAPQVLAAALDDDCCSAACSEALDGKRCPPNCEQGSCGKVLASLAAPVAPYCAPVPAATSFVLIAERSPALPLVVSDVFQPPRA